MQNLSPVQAGTYIRTLCVHLGFMLGVGAHMQAAGPMSLALCYEVVEVFPSGIWNA